MLLVLSLHKDASHFKRSWQTKQNDFLGSAFNMIYSGNKLTLKTKAWGKASNNPKVFWFVGHSEKASDENL